MIVTSDEDEEILLQGLDGRTPNEDRTIEICLFHFLDDKKQGTVIFGD